MNRSVRLSGCSSRRRAALTGPESPTLPGGECRFHLPFGEVRRGSRVGNRLCVLCLSLFGRSALTGPESPTLPGGE